MVVIAIASARLRWNQFTTATATPIIEPMLIPSAITMKAM